LEPHSSLPKLTFGSTVFLAPNCFFLNKTNTSFLTVR
jgi:hypothetical protein